MNSTVLLADEFDGGADDAALRRSEVGRCERIDLPLDLVVDRLLSVGGRGSPAARAVLVMGREQLATVPAGLPARVRRVIVGFGDAGRSEDVVVQLLGLEMDVPLPHVGVNRPLNPMLDLRLRVPFPEHPRDCGVPEVVGIHGFLDARAVCDTNERLADVIRGERPVVLLDVVTEPLHLVDERRVRLVRSWMAISEVVPQDRGTVDERIRLDVGALQPDRVTVRAVRRLVGLQIDVLDAERPDEREARARVGENLDERNVTLMASCIDETRNIVRRQHIGGIDLLVVGTGSVDILDPVLLDDVAVEDTERVLSVPNRGVGEVVVVAHVVDECLVGVLVEVDEGVVGDEGAHAEASRVGFERRDGGISVSRAEESFDGVTVAVVDVGVVEAFAFPLEAALESLDIFGAAHGPSISGVFFKLLVSKSTSSIFSEGPKQPPETTGSHRGVAA